MVRALTAARVSLSLALSSAQGLGNFICILSHIYLNHDFTLIFPIQI